MRPICCCSRWMRRIAARGWGAGCWTGSNRSPAPRASRFRVEARADNAGALAFYRKHGYVESEQVLGMYFGAEDGVALSKRL